ncbi:MAG: DUF2877 domain-containing protein [Nitriliruptorales bacterium]|nr:DUF2877 domain-containing protein [Nitriliruptorales bacterium]
MSAVLPLRTKLVGRAAEGISAILDGPARPACVVGLFETALYLRTEPEDEVVAVVSREGVALPNAILLPILGTALELHRWQGPFVLGGGRVQGADVTVVVDSWFDARPNLPPAGTERVRGALADLERALGSKLDAATVGSHLEGLADALRRRDPRGSQEAVRSLVGLGPGLTPTGDDVVAGAVAAGLSAARRFADPTMVRFFEHVGACAVAAARGRTTHLSVSLLGHAARGEMAAPARRLVEALFGRGQVGPAVGALLRVGHSSGRDLGWGISLGLHSVLHGRDRRSHE